MARRVRGPVVVGDLAREAVVRLGENDRSGREAATSRPECGYK
jgi:hypothetical protein